MKTKKEIIEVILIITAILLMIGLLVFNPFADNTKPKITLVPSHTAVALTATSTVAIILPPVSTITTTPTNSPTAKIIRITATSSSTPTKLPTTTFTPNSTSEAIDHFGGFDYTIIDGDNLWNLSDEFYQDGTKYDVICNVNKLIHNCGLIHAGNTLSISVILREIK